MTEIRRGQAPARTGEGNFAWAEWAPPGARTAYCPAFSSVVASAFSSSSDRTAPPRTT
jgi:hypothetical protein